MEEMMNSTPTIATESVSESVSNETTATNDNQVSEPVSTPTETVQESPKIKVKYNHQEIELPYEEAVQHIQKGMNYDKGIERAKVEAHQAARDSYIAEQGYEWMGRPITTEAEYRQAVHEQELTNSLQEQYSNLPEEVVQEILESRRERQERMTEKQRQAEEQKQNKEYQDFFTYFEKANKRPFNGSNDVIPVEVWEKVNQGIPLKSAYAEHRAEELEAKLQALETNKKNASSGTGSVTGQGETKDGFISSETFEANKADRNWVNKNYKKLIESRAKW